MTPKNIGPYEIKAELGRGGMATVYRAYDPRVEREVAIKVLPREMLHDPQFHVRFEREIKMVAKLEHPAIVPIYDVGDLDGQPYFVMRLMSGGTLSDWIEKGGFSVEDTARIIDRLASGLAYAHKKGIIHRDLKPGNVLFDQNGDPYLSDFGVAKFMDAAQNVTGSAVIGTPAYMSPEQAQSGDIDARSDVYGLGAIIFEMLSGTQPYSAETPMGVVVKHITEPVPEILESNPDLPEAVDTLIKTAMAKDKDHRFATTSDLAKALNAIATGEQLELPKSFRSPSKKSAKESNKILIPIIFGLIVVGALAGLFAFRDKLPFAQSQATEIPASTEKRAPFVDDELAQTVEPLTISPVATDQQFAPICQNLPPKCVLPTIDTLDKFCVSKVPYTLMAMPENSTFEALSPELSCTSEGASDGTLQVSCHGPDLLSFDLKVCDSACKFTGLTKIPTLCAEGLGYYAENGCCAPLPPENPPLGSDTSGQPPLEPGCTIIKVDLRQCN